MATTSPAKEFVRARTTTLQVLLMVALTLAGILLFSDLPNLPNQLHAYLSSLALATAGVGYGVLQLLRRPPLGTMLKRLLLAATFVLWAIDQLLPAGKVATLIGDVVIAAYILDLYWLIQEQVASADSTASR
jgi:hypothetical protein